MRTNDIQKQEEYFKTNISNMVNVAQYKYYAKFTDFLDEHQQVLAKQQLNRLCFSNYFFFGGTDVSTRKILGVFPTDEEISVQQFPITILQMDYSNQISLTHRDFLGSLMGLQITRDCIGDILVGNGTATVFVTEEIADFILLNLNKVGKTTVKIGRCSEITAQYEQKFNEICGTISSMRLDCIVAFLTNKSRTLASELIEAKRVKVNYFDITSISHTVKPNDVITVQGKGKFIISDEIKPTKKNRLHVQIKQYI